MVSFRLPLALTGQASLVEIPILPNVHHKSLMMYGAVRVWKLSYFFLTGSRHMKHTQLPAAL